LLKDAINKFLTILNETEPQFIAELTIQQLRKTILELIQRIPLNDHRSYTKDILLSIYSLVEKENEENVLICFRLLIDYYRHFKPQLNNEVSEVSVKYEQLLSHTRLISFKFSFFLRKDKSFSIILKIFTENFPAI
jgi:hypothetical protein